MTDTPPPASGELTLGQQRAAACPIKPCRGADDNDTLLRSIRSDRLLCMHCATRTVTGYMGREEARAAEDKFYKAADNDLLIQGAVCGAGALIAALISMYIGFFLVVFIVGAAAGSAIATFARRLTGMRLSRYSPQAGVAGVAVGTVLALVLYPFLLTGQFIFNSAVLFNINGILCGAIVAAAVYAVMKGRI
jgi:hypothetical protein